MTADDPQLVGELVEVPESGYLYGIGNLVLRVTAVEPMVDRAWVRLTGHEVAWNGQRVGLRAVVAQRSAITLVRHPA